MISRGDTNPVVGASETSVSCQDLLVANLKFDSGGCCEMMAFRIIRTIGIYKKGLACRTCLPKIWPLASELREWKSGLTSVFTNESSPVTGEICEWKLAR